MSQKTGKRSRRPTEEDLQLKPDKPNKEDTPTSETTEENTDQSNNKPELNGNNSTETTNNALEINGGADEQTVSSPINETVQENNLLTNGNNDEKSEKIEHVAKEIEETERNGTAESEVLDSDPLVVTDEVCPELVFDDNSDLESGKSSPIIPSRCVTRRSQMRNIPTPQTPKLEEKVPLPEPSEVDLNGTFESSEAGSTKVEVGSDTTRMEYLGNTSEPSQFLITSKDKSYVETLRNLSTRRTIRSVDEYRRKALQNKSDLNLSYPSRSSVERVSVGGKRKNDEDEVEGGKRYKFDSSFGFLSRLTSPLSSLKRTFSRSDLVSSTPKLTGYKDGNLNVEEERVVNELGEKRWCSIM